MYNPPHPGEILRELYVEPLGLTVSDLAARLGVTRNTVSQLLNGRRGVSPEMALRLAKVFGTSAELWLGLEQKYALWQAQARVNLDAIATIDRPRIFQ